MLLNTSLEDFIPQPEFLLPRNVGCPDGPYQFKYSNHHLNHEHTEEETIEHSVKLEVRPLEEQIKIETELLYAYKRDIWVECYLPRQVFEKFGVS